MTLKGVTQMHDIGENDMIQNQQATNSRCSELVSSMDQYKEEQAKHQRATDGCAKINNGSSPISQFYKNKSVFITGATGFLGKALLEKLLWQYDDIKHIYILVRAKRGRSVEQRFKEQLASSPIFDRMKARLLSLQSKLADTGTQAYEGQKLLETLLASKVKCIVGDASLPRLSINDSDWQTLIEDDSLTIIFHLAATVKFNEPLRHAIQMNVGGVKSVIRLARSLKNLECLCHVSTAYVNADILDPCHIIEERVYPVEEDPEKMLNLVEYISDDYAKLLEKHYLKDKPNTYTYTKSLAEKLIAADDSSDLPVVIIRPSIVTPAWREPSRGWVDNFYGITGMALAYATGLLRVAQVDPTKLVDLIPVDACVSTMIAATWYEATNKNKRTIAIQRGSKLVDHNGADIDRGNQRDCVEPEVEAKEDQWPTVAVEEQEAISGRDTAETTHSDTANRNIAGPKIYHCTSTQQHRVSWSQVISYGADINIATVQVGHLLRAPRVRFSRHACYVRVTRFFCHTLVAFIIDLIYSSMGHRAQMMRTYKKLDELMGALSYFTCNQWRFKTNNIEHLYRCLSDTDKQQLHSMNLSDMHWQTSWYDSALCFRRYLLKRDLKKLPSDLRNLQRIRMVDVSLRSVSLLIVASSILWAYPFSRLTLTHPPGIICFVIYIMLNIIVWH